jgi:hypothetical protein
MAFRIASSNPSFSRRIIGLAAGTDGIQHLIGLMQELNCLSLLTGYLSLDRIS